MKPFKIIQTIVLLVLVVGILLSSLQAAEPEAATVLDQCITAMGGLQRLQSVKLVSYQAVGHTLRRSISMGDSEPGVYSYETKEVTIEPQRQLIHEQVRSQLTESQTPSSVETLISPEGGYVESNGKRTAVSADHYYAAVDTLASNPVVALLVGKLSRDLRLLQPTADLYKLQFSQTVYGQEVETSLFIDRKTFVLHAIELKHNYSQDVYAAIFGPTTKRYEFAAWLLDSTGLLLPTKYNVYTNGLEDGQVSFLALSITPSQDEQALEIPAEYKDHFSALLQVSPEDFAKRNLGNGDHSDVSPDIALLPGKERAYNTLLIKQEKGVVIVEAPYSNANSQTVLEYAHVRFPGAPIKAIVSTDQFWFHMGGLGEYVKAQVPMYVLDSNTALAQWLLSFQVPGHDLHKLLHVVTGRTELGSSHNRAILLPFRGRASQRMLAVYLPETKFLYCSDLYLPQAWGRQYWTEHLAEIRELIQREHLDVQQIAGESEPPHDWGKLAAAIPQ